MKSLTTPLHRLVHWIRRRRTWPGFAIDLGELSIEDSDVYRDLVAGRD
jgi:hypothetical protein